MSVSPKPPVRLYMVDDHPAVRQGLRLLLELEGVLICGEAGDIPTALEELPTSSPDLVMVDLSLGKESGLTLLKHLSSLHPQLPLLVYSMHEDSFHIRQALAAGASGYVTKREMASVLTDALGILLAGRHYLSPRAQGLLGERSGKREVSDPLSPRELRVYHLLGEGYTTAGIAGELCVSRRTVDSYFARILDKLDVHGMDELRRRAATSRIPE